MRGPRFFGVAGAVLFMASPAPVRGQAGPETAALVVGARFPQSPAVLGSAAEASLQAALARADTTPAPRRRTPGLRGAVIGALLGAGAGALFVRGVCDVEDCASHPDTRRILLGGIGTGALVGFTVDAVLFSPRRSSARVRRVHGARSVDVRADLGRH